MAARRRTKLVCVAAVLFLSSLLAVARYARNAATRTHEDRRARLLEETLASAGWREHKVTSLAAPEAATQTLEETIWASLENVLEQLHVALATKNDVVAATRTVESLKITNSIVSLHLARIDTSAKMADHYASQPDPLGMTDAALRQATKSGSQIERAVMLRRTFLSLLRSLATNGSPEVRMTTFELTAEYLESASADRAMQAARPVLQDSLQWAYVDEDDGDNVTRMAGILDRLEIQKSSRHSHFALFGWHCSTEAQSVLSRPQRRFEWAGYTCAKY